MKAELEKQLDLDDALRLVCYIRRELLLGTEYRNNAGKLLTTCKQVLECLKAEGGVTRRVVRKHGL